MDNKINVLEYFFSIDGETKRSGELVWFIRLAGCNLTCTYCDTDWCHNTQGEEWDPKDLVKTIMKTNNCRKVTVTGGEPLTHDNIQELIKELLVNNFEVNVETNGSVNPYKVLDKELLEFYTRIGQLWFSMDYKSKYSEMQKCMLSAKIMSTILGKNDCLKFVVANEEDLYDAYQRITSIEKYYDENEVLQSERCTYYFSPCFGTIELPKIIQFMMDKKLYNRVRFQIQVHKIVWDPNARGV